MSFNWELAKAFGFEVIEPKVNGRGNCKKCDVYVSKSTSKNNNRYRFSFSKEAFEKLNATKIKCVLIPSGEKLFLVPCEEGYSVCWPTNISKNRGTRPFFSIAQSLCNDISNFLGCHDLIFSKDLNGYYIALNQNQEKEATA